MRLSRIRATWRGESDELNITAFMNLMVILVPFLLITAIFSQMSILRLDIPSSESQEDADTPALQLEVHIRKDALYLLEAKLGQIGKYPWKDGIADWKAFGEKLLEIKKLYPSEQNIALLVAPDVDYQELISVMDHVSSVTLEDNSTRKTQVLFPGISVGDAPALKTDTQEGTP